MQAQSHLAESGGSGSSGDVNFSAPRDEHEAVVRELTRGHELTVRLQAEALCALRGQGQAEATTAFILREVSRAFTVCLSIMAGASPADGPAPSPRPATPDSTVSVVSPPRAREDNVPRKRTLTPSPHHDGYQWRKYGQKRINNTNFPRSYYRCSYHRERNCPAQKQVQQHNDEAPPLFSVVYAHEHTCQASDPVLLPDATNGGGAAAPDYFPDGTTTTPLQGRAHGAHLVHDSDRAAQEERERQLLVSSLSYVLQGRHLNADDDCDWRGAAGAGHAPAPAPAAPQPVAVSSDQLPGPDAGEGLDVMDYDVSTDPLCWLAFGTDV